MAVISKTVTVTAEAYTANDVVGQLMELRLQDIYQGCRCMLQSITITDLAKNNTTDYQVFFFNRKPTNGTYTDGAALTIHDSDMAYCIGSVMIDATAVASTAADNCVLTTTNINLPLEAGAIAAANADAEQQSIWALANTLGTPTYASVADIAFKFGFCRSEWP